MSASPRRATPLLLICALGIERAALSAAVRGRGTSGVQATRIRVTDRSKASEPKLAMRGHSALDAVSVLRTGMGPRACAGAVEAALRGPVTRDLSWRGTDQGAVPPLPPHRTPVVLVTGFCAGLAPGMCPGDLVVASRVVCAPSGGASGEPLVIPEAVSGALSVALAAHGFTVHTGPLISTDHLVRAQERARLHSSGAIAADMESAAALRVALTAGCDPVAAVRVVVDTPEDELIRLRTLRTGIAAFRSLRAAVPPFLDWHSSLAGTGAAQSPLPLHRPPAPPRTTRSSGR